MDFITFKTTIGKQIKKKELNQIMGREIFRIKVVENSFTKIIMH